MADNIKFKRRGGNYFKSGKSVGISENVYDKIRQLSDDTGLTMSEIASELIAYALEHVELTD